VGTLLSFATLGVGFLMRPIGGSVGGYLADRFGRKPVLVGALLLMGIATFAIGLLPTYAQVGILAPILLVSIRIIQGLAFGAEWGGAVMMAYEHAPWRRRGRFAAIPQAGNPLGIALANIAFLAAAPLDSDWSWRIPFLASAVLIVVGLYVRLRLNESPEFEEAKATGNIVRNPFFTVIRQHPHLGRIHRLPGCGVDRRVRPVPGRDARRLVRLDGSRDVLCVRRVRRPRGGARHRGDLGPTAARRSGRRDCGQAAGRCRADYTPSLTFFTVKCEVTPFTRGGRPARPTAR
jgi:MFS family permease